MIIKNLKENELENLDAELKLLSNAENVKQQLDGIYFELNESEQSVVQQIKSLNNKLQSLTQYHSNIQNLFKRLQATHIELSDIADEVELINMGVLKEFRGLKLGSTLVNHAVASASRKNPERMWVHTCSLDHKRALQNYKSKGFEIFKEEEIDFVA